MSPSLIADLEKAHIREELSFWSCRSDAQTGKLTAISDMPLYAKILFLSLPLHFGNYGGLPLKIIWALLDLAAIVVLGSGVYLWIGRRCVPIEKRLAELLSGATQQAPV